MIKNQKTKKLIADLQYADLFDPNNPYRRYFRLWLDGSYLGEEHYRRNIEQAKRLWNKPRRNVRAFVLSEWNKYNATDLSDYSHHQIARAFKEVLGDRLEEFNDALIEDFRDEFRELVEEQQVA